MRAVRDRRSPWICSALPLLWACAGTAPHRGSEGARVTPSVPLASQILIPHEAARGVVHVHALGIARLTAGDRHDVPTLQVRLTVGNDGDDAPWVVDTRAQRIAIPGEGESSPLFVNGDRDSLPVVRVGRHEQRVFDLYFPLPATVRDLRDLGRIELTWQVRTADQTVTEERALADLALGTAPGTAGVRPYWWLDPSAAATDYVHNEPIHVPYPSQVTIARPADAPIAPRPGRG